MISGDVTEFYKEPFPHGFIDNAVDNHKDYKFPERLFSDFMHTTGHGFNKFYMNAQNPMFRHAVETEPWNAMHKWVQHGLYEWVCQLCLNIGVAVPKHPNGCFAKMDFSLLTPPDGVVAPHTDSHNKMITLIWYHSGNPAPLQIFEGGKKCGELAREIEWKPNRVAFFFKRENSWHGVAKLSDHSPLNRKTVTLNLVANKH